MYEPIDSSAIHGGNAGRLTSNNGLAGHIREGLKVMKTYAAMTREEVEGVWAASREIIYRSAEWLQAIRENRIKDAIRARHRINTIKRNMLERYNLIL